MSTNKQDAMAQFPMSNTSLLQSLSKLNALQGMATPSTPTMPRPGDQPQFYFLPEVESRSALPKASTPLPTNEQDATAMAQAPMGNTSLLQSPGKLGAPQEMAMPATSSMPSTPSMSSVPTMPRPGDQPQFYFLPEVESRSALPKANMSLPTNEQDATAMTQAPMGNTSLLQSPGKLGAPQEMATPSTPTMPRSGDQPRFYFLPEVESRSALPKASTAFDVHAIRQDFPILHQEVNGKPLIWLDNAATSQKPSHVIDTLSQFYRHDNSNVHRAAHTLAARSTDAYEGAREKVQRFLGAQSAQEIVFVRGTTEGINLVAQTYGRKYIGAGDEIVLTTLEHHSNIVPWQLLAQETGAVLRVVPIDETGEVILEEYERLLGPRTRLVAVSQVSNALGTVLPVAQMAAMAHRYGARILVDGAQAVPHLRVNVQAMDADFYTFSGHKLFGPTGIGALYGKLHLLEDMPPWQGGGSMIDTVTFEETTYNNVPYKFEAGTGNIAGAVGLGAAIDYLEHIGFEGANLYEEGLMAYATEAIASIANSAKLRQIGTASSKVSVLSFVLDGTRPEDVGTFLDKEGIAVRAGHHCAQPTMSRYGLTGTVRPSLAFYNTYEEIDALVSAILKYRKLR